MSFRVKKPFLMVAVALALAAFVMPSPATALKCKSTTVVGYGKNKDKAWTNWVHKVYAKYGPLWQNLAISKDQKLTCSQRGCRFSARPCKSHS